MANAFQKLTISLLPDDLAKAAERESKNWVARCRCGHERSIWDLGGIRYKACGRPRRLLRCPSCKQITWHRVTYRGQVEQPVEAVAVGQKTTNSRGEKFLAVSWSAVLMLSSIVSAVLAILGSVFVVIAMGFLLTVLSFTSSGNRTTGTVVDLHQSRGYRPVVAYSVDDHEFRVRGRVAMTPARYELGESVSVYYDPTQPSDARIDDWIERGGPFACVGSILGLIGTGGLCVVWWRLRRRRKHGS